MNKTNKTNITPLNNKNQPHGYWKVYRKNNKINHGRFINDIQVGYWDFGAESKKIYYIK